MSPVSLNCEYLRNPLGIDVSKPRLSWASASAERGSAQSAYQILVASSEELLKADQGDLWDSGKVESDQSAFVEYAGKPLVSEMRCYWKVRVWDQDGKCSDWSETAYWTMGLLNASDWKGKWIAYRAELNPDETYPLDLRGRTEESPKRITQRIPSPLLRKEFEASKQIKRATVYISGLGFYELRLNGQKVGDRVLDPAYTRYDKRALYVTHDVTDLLREGENAVGVMLGNGWYNCHTRDSWDFDHAPWRNPPKMLFQMKVEYADGSSDLIVSDDTWKTATGPITFDSIRNGEEYDARLERPGWDMPGYDASDAAAVSDGESSSENAATTQSWKPAEIVDGPGGKLVAEKIPPAKVIETAKPVSMTEPKPGVFVFDMGRNISGWCKLTVSGPAGTTVTIKYDERLHADGTLNQQNAGHMFTGDFQRNKYTLKGSGAETWEPRFVYNGFQYAQVEGFPGRPTLDSLQLRIVHADLETAGSFECSNGLINQLQTLTRRSFVSNFVSYPTDCPHREKNGWTGDAQVAAETGLYNFDTAASYTRWMDDFDDCQREDGNLPGIVPTGTWGYDWGNGPAWDSAYFLIPWYVYLYKGDDRLLKAHYDGWKRYLDFVMKRSPDHIADFGLGDWCPPEGGPGGHKTPAALTSTGYYFVDAKLASEVAAMLGKDDDKRYYAALAESVRKAFMEKFYKPETGTFEGDEQCGMATALYQKLLPQEEKKKVFDALVDDVENKRDGHLWAGILGTKYLLHALTDNGRPDVAYRVVTQKTWPSWGYWIEKGATSLWEDWDGGASLNHIMFGDISAWFYETLAGINPNPSNPGFKHVVIRPRIIGDLTWVKAEHRTMYGTVRSSWKLDNGKLTIHVEVPGNTTADVFVPASDPDEVTESGGPASKAECVKFLRMDSGCAVFEVKAGTYEFVTGVNAKQD